MVLPLVVERRAARFTARSARAALYRKWRISRHDKSGGDSHGPPQIARLLVRADFRRARRSEFFLVKAQCFAASSP